MKKLILITFLLIGLLLAGLGVFVYLPTIIQGLDFSGADFRRYQLAEEKHGDGPSWIQTAELMLPEETRGYIIVVPDRDYDKDWNSPGNQTRPGLRFARRLVENNLAVVRYSPPGSGDESIDLTDPEKSVRAFLDVVQALQSTMEKEDLPRAPISILSVGEGCLVSVMALQEPEAFRTVQPDRLILANCAYSGTPLKEWAGRVFYNMELTGASSDMLEESGRTWKRHREKIEAGEIPEMDEEAWEERLENLKEQKLHSDILALEKTISHLYRPSNRDWTRAAAHIDFPASLRSLIESRPGLDIIHVLSEYDEEIHPEDARDQENFVRSSDFSNYSLKVLERTDHGFVLRDSPPASPVENMMRRRDPFVEFSPELMRILAGEENGPVP
ncbi:MAG TPA: hypothetical protein DEA96_03080 [Leptospiraceae bacterium]|nr:hypothetical protein [Spirochaetaceae bacterium]HBS03922.1 hypothetical protein [Leptospiraceae bacterium]